MAELRKSYSFLSLKEYYKIARRFIKKYGATYLLYDEDAISYIMNALMRADESFNGMGNRMGWRGHNAKLAIKDLFKPDKNKLPTFSSFDYTTIVNTPIASRNLPQMKFIIAELQDYVKTSKLLSPTEQFVIEKVYFENWSQGDVAFELKKSKQAIQQSIASGINKLRWRFNDLEV